MLIFIFHGIRPRHTKKRKHEMVNQGPTALVHLTDELVDIVFTITLVASFNVVLEFPRPPATSGVRQLEWPKEVGSLFEVGPNRDDFVNEVLD